MHQAGFLEKGDGGKEKIQRQVELEGVHTAQTSFVLKEVGGIIFLLVLANGNSY